jgi:hypothetical protein
VVLNLLNAPRVVQTAPIFRRISQRFLRKGNDMTKNRVSFATALLLAALASGCSEGVARQTITGPSPAVDAAVAANPAPIADRTGATRAAERDEVATWASSHGWGTAADGIVVEATESITAVSDACPTKTITIRGVPVALTSTTTYTSPMTCAALAVGTSVKVTALLTFTATGFTVTATNVAPGATSGGSTGGGTEPTEGSGNGGGKKARGEGVVGAITGSCPTLTLVITGTKVSTTATTEYVNGSCATLRPGTKVTIDGELKPGGEAVAEKITIQRTPGRPVSGDGRVDTVTGSCPALTLSVRGVTVVTTSETTFTGGACSAVQPGSQIDVTGEYDGTQVAATAVHIKRP